MKPSAAAVRRMRPLGWADFKSRLVRAGVIAAGEDVPEAWRVAFCAAFGRTYPAR